MHANSHTGAESIHVIPDSCEVWDAAPLSFQQASIACRGPLVCDSRIRRFFFKKATRESEEQNVPPRDRPGGEQVIQITRPQLKI